MDIVLMLKYILYEFSKLNRIWGLGKYIYITLLKNNFFITFGKIYLTLLNYEHNSIYML